MFPIIDRFLGLPANIPLSVKNTSLFVASVSAKEKRTLIPLLNVIHFFFVTDDRNTYARVFGPAKTLSQVCYL